MSKSEDSDFEAFSKELDVSPLDLDAIQMFNNLSFIGFIETNLLI
jgi:hypothetical protein